MGKSEKRIVGTILGYQPHCPTEEQPRTHFQTFFLMTHRPWLESPTASSPWGLAGSMLHLQTLPQWGERSGSPTPWHWPGLAPQILSDQLWASRTGTLFLYLLLRSLGSCRASTETTLSCIGATSTGSGASQAGLFLLHTPCGRMT